MSHLKVQSNLIGVPDIEIPLEEDLLKLFQASQGQLMVPIFTAQILRELKGVKEGLRKLEVEIAALASTPERLRLD